MADGGAPVEVLGLTAWVTALKGPAFKDVNRALRAESYEIATQIVPEVEDALKLSKAPQAERFVGTVKAKSDRVPVVVIGKTNPKLKGFSRRGPRRSGKPRMDAKWRRGAMAHGIIYGPNSGSPARVAPAPSAGRPRPGNYRMGRDRSGGAVMRSIESGQAFEGATEAYFEAYRRVLRAAGINLTKGR